MCRPRTGSWSTPELMISQALKSQPSACFAMRSDSKQLKEAVRDVPGNYRLQTR